LAATQEAAGTEQGRSDVDDAHVLMVSRVTLGDPGTLTGGYLYHQRIAALAPRFAAHVRFVSVPAAPFPLPVATGPLVLRRLARQHPDVLLLDSIAAGYLGPWLPPRRSRIPVVAVLHQPPGGIDHGRVRTATQALLDRWAYRTASPLSAASAALADDLAAAGLPRARLRVVPPGRDVAPSPVKAPAISGWAGARRCCRPGTGWRARGCSTCSRR
ncbi:MAG: glycosyl transferase group 1, partial [Blastococcus sp.]|nr:glycosyl transferase group 1 [Blastococcus sp.]